LKTNFNTPININDLYTYNCGTRNIEMHKTINDITTNIAFKPKSSENVLESLTKSPLAFAISLTPRTLIPNIENKIK